MDWVGREAILCVASSYHSWLQVTLYTPGQGSSWVTGMAEMACSSNLGAEGAAQALRSAGHHLAHHDGGGVVFNFFILCNFKSGGIQATFVGK